MKVTYYVGPPFWHGGVGRPPLYPFRDMQPGEVVVFPRELAQLASGAMRLYKHRHGVPFRAVRCKESGRLFVTRLSHTS